MLVLFTPPTWDIIHAAKASRAKDEVELNEEKIHEFFVI